jgi:leucyl aminopeptidase (aminopeptidase T)
MLSIDPIQGARKIIQTCLNLSAGQELLLLFDETTREVVDPLQAAAAGMHVLTTAIYVPVDLQKQYGHNSKLPMATEVAIKEANGIVTLLSDSQNCLSFRKAVLLAALDRWKKIGHMPGANLHMLAMADSDYNEIEAVCNLLAVVLLRGKHMRFGSTDRAGVKHWLDVEIGGWERPPVISSGIIKQGSWGNIPPGETFIAPIEGTGSGSIVLNGSLPGYVLPEDSEVLLEFEIGRLVRYSSSDPKCMEIIKGLQDYALKQGDENWNNLAEIGIGVNRSIQYLTGVELVDEKMLGTAHIALGENNSFGGTVTSAIHTDLIVRDPTLEVDGRTIICHGELITQLIDWQINHRDLDANHSSLNGFHSLRPSGVESNLVNRVFFREWKNGRGEPGWLQVGHPDSTHKAGRIYKLIHRIDTRSLQANVDLDYLTSHSPELSEEEIRQLILLLFEYELIVIL